jgi:uncharacterized SAM-binding protein YcdF (DUF218 family)
MFFYLSKLIWFLVQPSSMLLLIFILGLVLYRLGRQKAAIRTLAAAVAIYAIGGLSPLPFAVMLSVEQQYAKPDIETIDHVDGIIILGGVIDTLIAEQRHEITLGDAAERLTEAAFLAKRFPQARVVFAGGAATLIYDTTDEASLAKTFLTRIGMDADRITMERESKNTYQNAVFAKKLIQPKPGERWLLITSAFHMPRAVGCFRAAGFEITPWPVDFATRGNEDLWAIPAHPSDGWMMIDLVAKEWVGTLVYALTGRFK